MIKTMVKLIFMKNEVVSHIFFSSSVSDKEKYRNNALSSPIAKIGVVN